jgi:hypothetical protein
MELKILIKSSEDRYVSYKKILEEMYKISGIPEWFREILRDGKNVEQGWLKKLVEEKSFENDGLNPPFCYVIKRKT